VDKEEETAFMTVFPVVLGFLVVFTVVIFVIARFIVPTPSEIAATVDSRVMMKVESRIEPVGKVRTSPPDKTVAAAAAAPAEPRSGEEVYNTVCAACHASGVANAPKFRDAASWASRIGKGIDTLVASAIKGIGTMPPRGGVPSIGDEEMRSAVEHMVAQ
jgi:cytochrome c5